MDGEEWARTNAGDFVKVHWITYWKYPMQLALYREAVNVKWGFRPHPFIAAMTKKDPVNFEVFDMMPDPFAEVVLKGELQRAIETMEEMTKYKDSNPDELDHCGYCDYCIEHKVLDGPVKFVYDPKMLNF